METSLLDYALASYARRAPVPELPDITIYVEALERHVVGRRVENVRIASPFLVRTVDPPVLSLRDRALTRVFRMGKRVVFAFDGKLYAVFHLMIAGRFHWKAVGAKATGETP